MTENDIGKIVVDECIQLHRALGPGLLEIVYEVTLARRLEKMGLNVVRQVSVPIEFEGEKFDERAAWGGVLFLLCILTDALFFRFVMDGDPRKELEARMTSDQIADAQKLAREWLSNREEKGE